SVLDRGRRTLHASATGKASGPDDGRHTRVQVPLRTRSGPIGVLEVVDPRQDRFSGDDEDLLRALADVAAAAYEQARFPQRVGAASAFRTVGVVTGFGLLALGLLSLLGALYVHLAWAIPLSELPARPGSWSGFFAALAGGALLRLCRRQPHRSDDVDAAGDVD